MPFDVIHVETGVYGGVLLRFMLHGKPMAETVTMFSEHVSLPIAGTIPVSVGGELPE